MNTEKILLEKIPFVSRTINLAANLADEHLGVCSRLYWIPAQLPVVAVITVLSSSKSSFLNIEEFCEEQDRASLFPDAPIRKAISPLDGQDFIRELASLNVWTLPFCETNCRDGFACVHVIAGSGKEWCIEMDNPDCHENDVYLRIVNAYSGKFLNHRFDLTQHNIIVPV